MCSQTFIFGTHQDIDILIKWYLILFDLIF